MSGGGTSWQTSHTRTLTISELAGEYVPRLCEFLSAVLTSAGEEEVARLAHASEHAERRGQKDRSRTPMKPSALARGARRQPASARAPFLTAAHARITLAPPDASAPTTPLRTASTASLLHCISSSLPSLLLPSSCTAAGTQPDCAAPRAPHHPHDARRTTHCHTISPQSPRARPS